MRFSTDDDRLTITVDLDDDDPDELDLTAGGLGESILAAAVDGMIDSARREQDPQGNPWPDLKRSTLNARDRHGYGLGPIGYNTGRMLRQLEAGVTRITPRSATWSYPQGDRYEVARIFHAGNDRQPARPLIGWTEAAEDEARRLVELAEG